MIEITDIQFCYKKKPQTLLLEGFYIYEKSIIT